MRLLLLILYSIVVLSANTIDAQIEAIRKAPVAKRFELMNAFKRQLVRMQEEERIKAIHKLKNITRSKHGNRAIKEIKTRQRAIDRNKHRSRHQLTKERMQEQHRQEVQDRTERTVDREIENHIEEQLETQIENHIEEGVEYEIENQLEDEHDDD